MSQSHISNRDFMASAGLMLSAALSLSLTSLFIKQLSAHINLSILLFFRFFIPFIILLWVGFVPFSQKISLSQPWRAHLLRAFFTVSSQYCLLIYLFHGSLLIGTLLFTSSGLFLPFLSAIFFAAAIRLKMLIAIIISFIGIVLILNPRNGLNWYVLVGLLAGFLNACSQLTVHYTSKRGSAFEVNLIMFGCSSIYAIVVITLFTQIDHLTGHSPIGHPLAGGYLMTMGFAANHYLWLMLILLAVFTISNQSLRTKAYGYVNKPASLTPFYYMTIVFSALFDGLIYHQLPTCNAYLGIFLIIIAAIWMSWRRLAQ